MPLVLARIDDRLIHGQVTVGWATHLKPDRILLANNEIAADDWQCQVYASSVSPGIEVCILSLAEAAGVSRPPHPAAASAASAGRLSQTTLGPKTSALRNVVF